MKKSTRVRPVLESLESMMLLSTATTPLHGVAQPVAHVHVVTTEAAITLSGTLHGTGKISGTSASVSGSGKLTPVGATTFKTKISFTNPPSNLTLTTKKGNLFLQASSGLVTTSTTSGSATYTITGGTKAYLNATGSGTVSASYSLVKGKLALTVRFS